MFGSLSLEMYLNAIEVSLALLNTLLHPFLMFICIAVQVPQQPYAEWQQLLWSLASCGWNQPAAAAAAVVAFQNQFWRLQQQQQDLSRSTNGTPNYRPGNIPYDANGLASRFNAAVSLGESWSPHASNVSPAASAQTDNLLPRTHFVAPVSSSTGVTNNGFSRPVATTVDYGNSPFLAAYHIPQATPAAPQLQSAPFFYPSYQLYTPNSVDPTNQPPPQPNGVAAAAAGVPQGATPSQATTAFQPAPYMNDFLPFVSTNPTFIADPPNPTGDAVGKLAFSEFSCITYEAGI